MGAQVCGQTRTADVVLSAIKPSEIEVLRSTLDLTSFHPGSSRGGSSSSTACPGPNDGESGLGFDGDGPASAGGGGGTSRCRPGAGAEADGPSFVHTERYERGFEPAAMIGVLFEVQPPTMQDLPESRVAVHRTTGMVRRLISVRKPSGVEGQERLRAAARRLHGLRSDGVARVLEVFEDARSLSLVAEHCNGGTIYDRILQKQFFTEQESAVLVRHILQSLASLHNFGMAHGFPTPDSFRFQSEQTHASLKLVDYGLDLKVDLWDAMGCASAGSREGGRRRTAYPQLFETCRMVFGAPEVVKPELEEEDDIQSPAYCHVDGAPAGELNFDLLAEAIDAHLEHAEEAEERLSMLEAADAWGVGAMAFLLLCGYPPFFAPCRHAIASRIGNTEFSFDPPFWSKISEEAKDFVQLCLRSSPERRLSVLEALRHPWIQSLADNSPGGFMLSSFALNLRRFYRTSLIETYAANSLAAKLSMAELCEFLARCEDADHNRTGFLTATDLRQVLLALGHGEIAEAISMCFARMLRHPGESYLDYATLMESAQLRRERAVEEELWRCFVSFKTQSASDKEAAEGSGRLPVGKLMEFFQAPDVQNLLARSGVEGSAASALSLYNDSASRRGLTVASWDDDGASGACCAAQVDFLDLASEVLRRLPAPTAGAAPVSPASSAPAPAQGQAQAQAQARAEAHAGVRQQRPPQPCHSPPPQPVRRRGAAGPGEPDLDGAESSC